MAEVAKSRQKKQSVPEPAPQRKEESVVKKVFSNPASSLDMFSDYLEREHKIKVSKWFLITAGIASYIIVNNFLTAYARYFLYALVPLAVIFLVVPNFRRIRSMFDKRKDEQFRRILLLDNQAVIKKLENYAASNVLSTEQLHTLFDSRFSTNVHVYELVFDGNKLAEDKINLFLDANLVSQPFMDDILMKKFIASCRYRISYDTFMKITMQMQNKHFSASTIRLFNYKYSTYLEMPAWKKKVLMRREAVVQDWIDLGALLFVWFFLGLIVVIFVASSLSKTVAVNQNPVYNAFGVVTMLLLFILIIAKFTNWLVTKILMRTLVSDKLIAR